jgi:fatty-acyl-CoA synthase
MLAAQARLFPERIGASDLERKLTFRLWYRRACRLANALNGIGLTKGDRICILAYNCVEWLEIYAASALAGLSSGYGQSVADAQTDSSPGIYWL